MSQSGGDKKLPSETAGYVGFANLPNQVHRKSVKKGFEFTLMVVGESGLGKSTLINSLFLTDLYPERYIPGAAEKIERTVEIEASTVEIEERGVKLRLTVVDTPGYGDAINSQDCFKTIIYYIDNQFERYLHDESGLNRRHIVDNRVHCCFYFISPFGHGLKPLDVEFMRALHGKVNIVPVIAKADTLTLKERERLKLRILDEISEHGIRIYQLPDADSDEDEEFKEQTKVLKNTHAGPARSDPRSALRELPLGEAQAQRRARRGGGGRQGPDPSAEGSRAPKDAGDDCADASPDADEAWG
ncbi:septin-2 isoform X3 [Monodelphis domestica]|uniref:septin-2 isoform X3 n=1 Tax=Monodelphis domestica TaxID=13616 RepID=UPI0007B40E9E|nr:septin-2 isoform X3 [Monodelphis domestica]XP_056677386.1 septin-2 isoform X3 [Monodelphis domestica]